MPDPTALARRRLFRGRLWIVAAALLWSSSGLFAKAPLFTDWAPADRGMLLAFWRAAFASLVLLPSVRRPRWRPGLIPLVLAFAGMNGIYLVGMSLTTAANAIWLQSTSPWWVFLITALFFRREVVGRDLVPLAFALLGVGLILAWEIRGQAPLGVACGLAAGFFYGIVVVAMWRLSAEDPSWLVALCHAVAALALLPCVLWIGIWPSWNQLAVMAAFGVLQMALPYLCLLRGLKIVSGQEAVAIGMIEPILMPLWVLLVWGERLAWWTVAGAGLILAGLVLRYVFLEGKPAPESAAPILEG